MVLVIHLVSSVEMSVLQGRTELGGHYAGIGQCMRLVREKASPMYIRSFSYRMTE